MQYINIDTLELVSRQHIAETHPNTSLPLDLTSESLEGLGFAVLEYDEAPIPEGKMLDGWTYKIEGHVAIASPLYTDAVVVIPSVVTMAQAKLALLYAGLYEQAEAFINDLPEPLKAAALIEWNHRQTLERTHPLVSRVAAGLELTEQQLDELFLDASMR